MDRGQVNKKVIMSLIGHDLKSWSISKYKRLNINSWKKV